MKAGRLGSTVRVMGNHCGMKCYDRVCAVEGMLGGLEWRMGGRLRRDSSHSKGEVVSTHPRAKDGENGGTVKKSGEELRARSVFLPWAAGDLISPQARLCP